MAAAHRDFSLPAVQAILRDARAVAPRHVFSGHEASVRSVAFSPDGQYALSGSGDNTLRLWDIATGEQVRVFEGHEDWVSSVAFSPDGQYALSGSCGKQGDGVYCIVGEMRLWDVSTGEEVRVFEGHTSDVRSVAFSPDGQYALSGSDDGTVRLWEVATGEEVPVFEGHEGWVRSVAFSPDGRYVLAGSCGRRTDTGTRCIISELRLWEVATGEEVRVFRGHEDWVHSVVFSPDGQYALSGSDDGTVWLWEVATWQEWTCANRHVVELNDTQREYYGLPDDLVLCPEE
jgi:WD40 repeat protein